MSITKLHQLTWEQVLTYPKAVINSQGELCAGPDRRQESGSRLQFSKWLKDCQFRAKLANDLSPAVMASFQALKHLTTPPEVATIISSEGYPEPMPTFKEPKWSWSFSAINAFNTCPLQYAHKYFYKTIKYQETAATKKGNDIHKSLERIGKGQGTDHDNALVVANKWTPFMEAISNSQGEKHFELEMALDENWKPTNWFNGTGRCKGDVVIINGDKANYIDWKTGKIKEDPLQLRLSLLFIALHFPEVKQFNGKFVWLEFNKVTGLDAPIPRKELISTYDKVQVELARIRAAWYSQVFPANPSGLCRKYCEVRSCPHCGKGA